MLTLCSSAAMIGASTPSTPAPARHGETERKAEPDADVDVDRPPALAAQPNAGAEPAQVVGHQREIGRCERDIRALRAHRDADGARAQRERVVDAVADHHRPVAVLDLGHHAIHLLLGQHLGEHFRRCRLRRHLVRDRRRSPVRSTMCSMPSSLRSCMAAPALLRSWSLNSSQPRNCSPRLTPAIGPL